MSEKASVTLTTEQAEQVHNSAVNWGKGLSLKATAIKQLAEVLPPKPTYELYEAVRIVWQREYEEDGATKQAAYQQWSVVITEGGYTIPKATSKDAVRVSEARAKEAAELAATPVETIKAELDKALDAKDGKAIVKLQKQYDTKVKADVMAAAKAAKEARRKFVERIGKLPAEEQAVVEWVLEHMDDVKALMAKVQKAQEKAKKVA